MQGLGWEICTDVREHSTPNMSMDLLVQYAQQKGDVCRRRHMEQRDKEDRRAKARRVRRAARPAPRKNLTSAVTAPPQVGVSPPGSLPIGSNKRGGGGRFPKGPPEGW